MYEKFFYLNEKPFHITPDPRFLYLSSSHREAIDLMTFGIAGRKGFILLCGEVGTGKTTLSRALLEKLPKKTESALILNPLLSDVELLKTITSDLGLKAGDSLKSHIDVLNAFLLDIASQGGTAAVIIDEAQNLSPKALEMVRLLSNLETEKEKLLQIILVGQPELKEKLSLPELRQLNQRMIIRYDLKPLGLDDTDGYIRNRLFVAGGASTVHFTNEAVMEVHRASLGIPRMINIICDRALTAAFVKSERKVGLEHVLSSITELEDDGYLTKEYTGIPPRYLRYIPHIAISAFAAALAAGIRLAPSIAKLASLNAGVP